VFKTTAIYENRILNRKELFSEISLDEEGNEDTLFYTKFENLLCSGYERIVFGDHGPYIEFHSSQIEYDNWTCKRQGVGYFDQYFPRDGSGILMYAQRVSVKNLPNPPKGRWTFRGNRKEGYADYKVGMFYISPWLKNLKIMKKGIVINNQKCSLSDILGG